VENPELDKLKERIEKAIRISKGTWKVYWQEALEMLEGGRVQYEVEMERKLEAIEKQMLYYDPDDERED
jgi:hypothetical protein